MCSASGHRVFASSYLVRHPEPRRASWPRARLAAVLHHMLALHLGTSALARPRTFAACTPRASVACGLRLMMT